MFDGDALQHNQQIPLFVFDVLSFDQKLSVQRLIVAFCFGRELVGLGISIQTNGAIRSVQVDDDVLAAVVNDEGEILLLLVGGHIGQQHVPVVQGKLVVVKGIDNERVFGLAAPLEND